MRAKKIAIALLGVFTFSVQILNAQPPPPQGGSTGAPIDGGAVLLLLAVAYYGYKRNKLVLQPVKA